MTTLRVGDRIRILVDFLDEDDNIIPAGTTGEVTRVRLDCDEFDWETDDNRVVHYCWIHGAEEGEFELCGAADHQSMVARILAGELP